MSSQSESPDWLQPIQGEVPIWSRILSSLRRLVSVWAHKSVPERRKWPRPAQKLELKCKQLTLAGFSRILDRTGPGGALGQIIHCLNGSCPIRVSSSSSSFSFGSSWIRMATCQGRDCQLWLMLIDNSTESN